MGAAVQIIMRFLLVAIVCILTPACSSRTDSKAPATGLPVSIEQRSDTRRENISIGSRSMPVNLNLFETAKTTLALPFTTYVPEDMIREGTSGREGDSVRWTLTLAGRRIDDAYVEVAVDPLGTTEADARNMARMGAIGRGLQPRVEGMPQRHGWSLSEYGFSRSSPQGTRVVGNITMGKHRDRFFYVVVNYPERDSPQFSPRAEIILREWRWEDTGEALDPPVR
jgi:hypothetical protein